MDIQALIAQAQAFENANRFAEAMALYQRAAAAEPTPALAMKLGFLSEMTEAAGAAARYYREALALQADLFPAVVKLAWGLVDTAPEDARAVMAPFVAGAEGRGRAEGLAQLATLEEWIARRSRGLPPSHVLDLAEFPFAFARDALGAVRTAPGAARVLEASAALVQGDVDAANRLFAAARGDRPGVQDLTFGAVPSSAVTLPPVVGDWPTESCLFVSCDQRYFMNFLLPLLKSLGRVAPEQRVHIHAMGPLADHAAIAKSFRPLRVSLTHEAPDDFIAAHGIEPSTYYGAARFVRFAQALEVNEGPLWMCDADALIDRDPTALLARSGDVGLRVRPGRIEPENQFSACLVMGRAGGRAYFRAVADIIAGALPRAFWGLDQAVLYSAYLALKSRDEMPALTLFGPEEASVDRDAPGVFWFTASSTKLRLFAKPPSATPTAYERLFRSLG